MNLMGTVLIAMALGTAGDPPPERDAPIPAVPLTLAHRRMAPSQGGQRVRVTIPVTPGVDAFGDVVSYRWDTRVGGGARCQPGPLPDLKAVTAGTVIDASLPRPPKSWCRGTYTVALLAEVDCRCTEAPETVAESSFRVGSEPRRICHRVGEARRCWTEPSRMFAGGWLVTALLDDLLGPDGATTEADPYFDRAFAHPPLLARHWEIDDNFFYGYPTSRAEAILMTRIVDRTVRAGPYYH